MISSRLRLGFLLIFISNLASVSEVKKKTDFYLILLFLPSTDMVNVCKVYGKDKHAANIYLIKVGN